MSGGRLGAPSGDPLRIATPGSLVPLHAGLAAGWAAETSGGTLAFLPPAFTGVLADRLLAGEAADVFIGADRGHIGRLRAAGLVPRPRVLAGNRLCLALRPDLVGAVRSLADFLALPEPIVVPPAASDPLGAYAEAAIVAAGLTALLTAKRTRGEVVEAPGHLAAMVAQGTAAGGVLYASWARALGEAVVVVSLPPPEDAAAEIAFAVGAVGRGASPRAEAERFVDWLLGPPGQAVLLAGGFAPHPAVGTWESDGAALPG